MHNHGLIIIMLHQLLLYEPLPNPNLVVLIQSATTLYRKSGMCKQFKARRWPQQPYQVCHAIIACAKSRCSGPVASAPVHLLQQWPTCPTLHRHGEDMPNSYQLAGKSCTYNSIASRAQEPVASR